MGPASGRGCCGIVGASVVDGRFGFSVDAGAEVFVTTVGVRAAEDRFVEALAAIRVAAVRAVRVGVSAGAATLVTARVADLPAGFLGVTLRVAGLDAAARRATFLLMDVRGDSLRSGLRGGVRPLIFTTVTLPTARFLAADAAGGRGALRVTFLVLVCRVDFGLAARARRVSRGRTARRGLLVAFRAVARGVLRLAIT